MRLEHIVMAPLRQLPAVAAIVGLATRGMDIGDLGGGRSSVGLRYV